MLHIRRRCCRTHESESGTATVEFTLVFALALTALFSIIEFGMFMNTRLVVTTAAREGARKAAVDGGASAQALRRMSDVLSAAGISEDKCKVSIEPKTASYGAPVTARVEYEYTVRAPFIVLIAGARIQVVAEVVSRSEWVN